jgi:hypothetical protein
MKAIFLLIIFSVFFISCEEQKIDEIEKVDDVEVIETDTTENLPTAMEAPKANPVAAVVQEFMVGDEEEVEITETKTKEIVAFKPEELRSYIPETLPNSESLGGSGGTRPGGEVTYTNGKMEYRFAKSKGYMGISLNDFASKETFPEDETLVLDNPPLYPDKVTEKIEIDGYKGYKQWDEKSRSGKIHLKIGDRFSLVIESVRLPEGVKLEDYFSKVKIDKLLSDAKK